MTHALDMFTEAKADLLETLVETCGPDGEVVKLMPPLTVADGDIDRALEILDASVKSTLAGLA